MPIARLLYIFFISLLSHGAIAQDLERLTTLDELLTSLAHIHEVSIIYNPKKIKAYQAPGNYNKDSDLKSLLNEIATYHDLELSQKTDVYILKPKKRYRLYGYVIDSMHTEILPFALIHVLGTNIVDRSSSDGYFNLNLIAGTHEIEISYLGRSSSKKIIDLQGDQYQDLKISSNNALPEIIISDDKKKSLFSNTGAFKHQDLTTISENTPSVGGSNDLLQSIRILPGVQSSAGGIGGLSVRGGTQDQNLILLDGVEIFNPFHSLGLTSIFTPETTKDLRIFTDQFHPSYGDRSSSVIDIKLKDATSDQLNIQAGINTQDAFLKLETPLKEQSSSLLAFVRTTTSPFQFNNIIQSVFFPFITTEGNISYLDAIVKARFDLHPKHKLSFTLFRTGDRSKGGISSSDNQGFVTQDGVLQFENNVIASQLKSIISKNLYLTSSLSATNYRSISDLLLEGEFNLPPHEIRLVSNLENNNNSIEGKLDLDYHIGHGISIEGGLGYSLKSFNSRDIRESIGLDLVDDVAMGGDIMIDLEDQINAQKSYQYLSVSLSNQTTEGFIGLRASQFNSDNTRFFDLQPRVWLTYNISTLYSITTSWNRTVQYLHFLSASEIPTARDFWRPSSEDLPPEHAEHFNLGFTYAPSPYATYSINIFSKITDNSTINRFIDDVDPAFLDALAFQNLAVFSGTATSRGIEFSTKHGGPNWQGIFSYTLSNSQRRFDAINLGESFDFQLDRRHEFKSSIFFNVHDNVTIGSNIYFGSGIPLLVAQFASSFGPTVFEDINDPGELNSIKDSWRYRFDLSMTYRLDKKSVDHFFKLNFYNTLGATNPLFFTNSILNESVSPVFSVPFIPSLSYHINF